MNRKILVTSPLLIGATIFPSLTLTSCSTISQYYLPVLTKGTNDDPSINISPFENGFKNSSENFSLIDPYLSNARDKDGFKLSEDLANIKNYLPNRFLYTSAFDNSFKLGISKFYSYNGYSSFNIDWWGNNYKDVPYQIDTNTFYDYKWMTTVDKNAGFLDSTGKINSYQNLINVSTSTSVNSISFNFLTMVNYMNNFINKIISQTDTNAVNDLLDNVFTHSKNNFNHGTKDKSQGDDSWNQNYDFFRFCYNNANLISTGDSQYKFGPYSVEWNQEYSGVDVGLTDTISNNTPFLKLEVQDLTKDPNHKFDTNNEKNKSLPYLIPTNTAFTGVYTYNTLDKKYDWQKAEKMSPYCIYSYDEKDKKHEQAPTGVTGIANIPMLVHLSNIDSNYYNPTIKSDSISINDWLIPGTENNINKINNEITKNKIWDNITKHVDVDTPSIGSVSFKQKFIERDEKEYTNYYGDWTSNNFELNKIDKTIKYWYENKLIKPGDYIALAQYKLMDISFKYYDTNGNEVNYWSKLPYFSGVSALIPAYFAFNFDYYSPIDNIKENDENKILNFAEDSKMYKDWSNIIKTLTQNKIPKIDKTEYNSSYDAFTKDPYMIFRWMFGGYHDDGEKITFKESDVIDSSKIYFIGK